MGDRRLGVGKNELVVCGDAAHADDGAAVGGRGGVLHVDGGVGGGLEVGEAPAGGLGEMLAMSPGRMLLLSSSLATHRQNAASCPAAHARTFPVP